MSSKFHQRLSFISNSLNIEESLINYSKIKQSYIYLNQIDSLSNKLELIKKQMDAVNDQGNKPGQDPVYYKLKKELEIINSEIDYLKNIIDG